MIRTLLFDKVRNQWEEGAQEQIRKKHESNNVYEKMERASSLVGLYHELVSDLQDGYISLASHKLNNIVKLLAVIFIPFGFLAGLYGMNLEHIPELKYQHGYFTLLIVMPSIAIGLLILFKKIKWL